MKIIETVDCPLCDGEIAVIVEDNKITSHGVCGNCDSTHSAERLQFQEDAQEMEDQFMRQEHIFRQVDDEVMSFHNVLWTVYFDELYQLHLEEMAEV